MAYDGITEWVAIDPDELHLVGTPANGSSGPLLAKAAAAQEKGKRVPKKMKRAVAKAVAVGQLDAEFHAAKAAYERQGDVMSQAAFRQAGQRRFLARLIQREHAAEKSMEAIRRSQRGQGNPLFGDVVTHDLRTDGSIEYGHR